MRSSAALSRRFPPSSSESFSAASSSAALWQGCVRSFVSKGLGDGLILHSTPRLEEEEHRNLFARDVDGLVSTTKVQYSEQKRFFTKDLLTPRMTLWAPLSCGCLAHKYQTGIAEHLMVSPAQYMRPSSLIGSVTQSNMYATSSRFEDKAKIRALMEARGLKKEPGWSRIEIQGQLNTFLVDDKSHPRNKEIREELQRMLEVMKDAGYVADLRCVLRDIPESEKEQALQHHSERLAMALGHLSLPPRAPMRIIKNLRVCNDCHVATKYFAYIYKREIIVRDATRFHHFREGYCSCGDYW